MSTTSSNTILLASCENLLSQKVAEAYQNEGQMPYNFLNTTDMKQVVPLAQRQNLYLILFDICPKNAPQTEVVRVIEQLKNQERTRFIPILMLAEPVNVPYYFTQTIQFDGLDYVPKPLQSTELLTRSKTLLQLTTLQKHLHEKNKEIYRLQHNKEQQMQYLAQKTRELSAIAMQIAQKNELLNDIKEKVGKMANSTLQKDIIKTIESNLQLDNYWEKFKCHFEEVHPAFFQTLAHYEGLSQNDLKLCAYIKMRLSNNEIAQLLNISPKGMETARYRLKKKLEISTQTDLNEFIQTQF